MITIALLTCVKSIVFFALWVGAVCYVMMVLLKDEYDTHGMDGKKDRYGSGTYGHTSKADGSKGSSHFAAMTGLVFFYFWTSGVINRLAYVTYCKVFGYWYFCGGLKGNQRSGETDKDDTKHYGASFGLGGLGVGTAYMSACTLHFGSVVFGSFIIAVVQTLEWIVKRVKEQAVRHFRLILKCTFEYFDLMLLLIVIFHHKNATFPYALRRLRIPP